jgi:hypothetical protein
MRKIPAIFVGVWTATIILSTGCELRTEDPDLPETNPANHLVINEVFTMPLDNPATYSWIELYNPTPDTINLTGWTLSYATFRFRSEFTVQLDSLGNFVRFLSQVVVVDSVGTFDVPFAEGVADIPGEEEDTVMLPPGGLFTLVSNEDRLLDHIQWGPGDERLRRERPLIQGGIESIVIISDTTQDSLITVVATLNSYGLFFYPTAQILLKDPSGNVLDVVRFGNYVYSGPGADPYPENVSFGPIPEYQSIQRYAGAYMTGNTANDFYQSSPARIATPQWYSLYHKQ